MATLTPYTATAPAIDPVTQYDPLVDDVNSNVRTIQFQRAISILREILTHSHSGAGGAQGIDTTGISASLTALSSKIASNSQVDAADITALATAYNNILKHTHLVGGTSSMQTSGLSAITPAVSAGSDITFATPNQLFAAINSLRTHTHTYFTGNYVYLVKSDGRYSAVPRYKPGRGQFPIHTYFVVPEGETWTMRMYGRCDDGVGTIRMDGVAVGSLNAGKTAAYSNTWLAPAGAHWIQLYPANGPAEHWHTIWLYNWGTGQVLVPPSRWFRGVGSPV